MVYKTIAPFGLSIKHVSILARLGRLADHTQKKQNLPREDN